MSESLRVETLMVGDKFRFTQGITSPLLEVTRIEHREFTIYPWNVWLHYKRKDGITSKVQLDYGSKIYAVLEGDNDD